MKQSLWRLSIIVGILIFSKMQLCAQPGCSPLSLPYYEDFENGFVLNNGWTNITSLDTSYVLVDNCWLQYRKHDCGWNSMCSWEYYFPGPIRNVFLRFGQRHKCSAIYSKIAISSTPVLASSPSGISFKACYYFGMTGPNGDSTSEGAQMVVGYTVQDEPLQVVPNPHHDGIDYISTSWDPLSYMVTNYDPAHNFVPIDTITVYSMNYLHYDDCRSNFICKGITVPPNSRLVFKACMPDSVDVMFQLDSLTIYGDYMSPDSMVAHKDTICAGSSYEGYGFSLPTILNPGTFVFEQWECVGNRSILHQLTLTVKTRKTSYFSYTISPGETVFFEDSTFTEAGSYTFNYTGFNGCDSVVILHISYDWQGVENSIWVPSAFTPNGDGLNDVFMPVFAYPERVDAYRLEIYDRIGSMIFATRRKDVGWDGGGCPDGVYPYIIRYSFLGETRQEKRGTVVLVH